MVGAATAKLREPKHVRTRGADSKLESNDKGFDERGRNVIARGRLSE